MQQILVTGGAGFIGAHLVERLLDDAKVHVCLVDDLSGVAFSPNRMLESIQEDRPGHLDIHFQPIEQFCPRVRFDTIYHLASIVGPAAVLFRAGTIAESIVRSSYRTIRIAMASRARLVNVSTSEVYGGGVNGYCQEDTPRTFRGTATARQEYAAGKMAVEIAIQNLCAGRMLDAVTVRPFNVAGPRQSGRGGFVLPRFIAQAILNEPLTVFGDGQQVRAFTDARDITGALTLCAEKGERGSIYNVGNPNNRVTIDELADRVLEVTESTGGKCHINPYWVFGETYAEAPDKFPDIDRIAALGWQPQYDLDETITATYEYMSSLSKKSLINLAGLATRRETREKCIMYSLQSQAAGVTP